MEAVIKAKPWLKDPLTVHKKWDEDEYQLKDRDNGHKPCFAIMWDDGVLRPASPITRALKRVQAALEKAGCNVITWYPIEHKKLCDLTSDIWGTGSTEDYMVSTSTSGEPIISTMVPDGDNTAVAAFRLRKGGISAYQLWQIQKERKDIRASYLEHWNNTVASTGTGRPVDAIICPAAPYAAPPHGYNKHTNYTTVWNAPDYTASIFPVTTVDPAIDVKQPRESFIDAFDQEIYEMYEPDVFRDAPICLQLVGRTLEEEGVIAMTEIVDAALKAGS